MKLTKQHTVELRKCQNDFIYFCEKYLKIITKEAKQISLKPNKAQLKFLATAEANPWVYVLKARQLGLTTIIAAKLFHKTLFTPNHKTAVIAHTREAAASIFEIYKQYYNSLPPFLRFKTEASNKYELTFFHGGYIRVGSSSSQSFRGSTYNSLHVSEFAFYENIEKTIQSVFQTATPDAEIFLETTANGINDAQNLWYKNDGFEKLFISWLDGEEYILNKKAKNLNNVENTYRETYNDIMSSSQFNWMIQTLRIKCAGNIDSFSQEYPIEADIAFITSGKPFFKTVYAQTENDTKGWIIYIKPSKYRTYIMGVDVASGTPNGDYSAATLLDTTDEKHVRVVATYYNRVSLKEYAEDLKTIINQYDPLTVIESNSYGQAIIEDLQHHGNISMYRRTSYDKIGNKWIEKIGFATTKQSRPVLLSRLHEHIAKGWLNPSCPRLANEMNSFVYNDKGKPEADKGKHDDLVMATGLALIGLDQTAAYVEEKKRKEKPANVKEMLEYEAATGTLYSKNIDSFHDPVDALGLQFDDICPSMI
tara:strand:- start:1517 stop:3124 length:1608 start_codon:yes stop_codon:yes gene_type:complete